MGAKKKWGASQKARERIIRDAIVEPETMSEINKYLEKAKIVTLSDVATRFNVRISIVKKIISQLEREGKLVPIVSSNLIKAYTKPDLVPEGVADKLERLKKAEEAIKPTGITPKESKKTTKKSTKKSTKSKTTKKSTKKEEKETKKTTKKSTKKSTKSTKKDEKTEEKTEKKTKKRTRKTKKSEEKETEEKK